jgi:hypothetical protein
MTTTLWLRISSIIALLFAAGHTLGGRKYWSPMGDNAVFQEMKKVHFDTMGVNRSYLDFYMGFGYSLSVAMIMQAVLLWQLSILARNNAVALRPIIAVMAVAAAASGIIAWRFIFLVPALSSLVLMVSLSVAYAVAANSPRHS